LELLRFFLSEKIFALLIVFSFGHSVFGAGVTVTIVETSNVGVKVGMVGKGVIEEVGVSVGRNVAVVVGIGDEVDVIVSTEIGAV